ARRGGRRDGARSRRWRRHRRGYAEDRRGRADPDRTRARGHGEQPDAGGGAARDQRADAPEPIERPGDVTLGRCRSRLRTFGGRTPAPAPIAFLDPRRARLRIYAGRAPVCASVGSGHLRRSHHRICVGCIPAPAPVASPHLRRTDPGTCTGRITVSVPIAPAQLRRPYLASTRVAPPQPWPSTGTL